jgi:hypothetical protein
MPPVQTCVCEQLPPSVQARPPSLDELVLVFEQAAAARLSAAASKSPERRRR